MRPEKGEGEVGEDMKSMRVTFKTTWHFTGFTAI